MKNQRELIEAAAGICSQVLVGNKTASADCLPELKAEEWHSLLSLSSKHSILPVVMHFLKGRQFEDKEVRRVVMKWYAIAQRHQLRYQVRIQTICELAGMFGEEGLDMMVFKGAALARLYPHPEWRVFSDIDFYLYGQWKKGVEVMERHGIKNKPYLHHNTEAMLHDVLLENHYDFVERLNHRMNLVLDDALKALAEEEGRNLHASFVNDGVKNVYVMTPTMDAILQMRHMSAHFVSEAIPLRMFTDWILFLKSHAKDVDWERVLPLYQQSGMTEFVGIVMALIRDYFHVAFPDVPIEPVSNENTEKVWQAVVFPPENNPYKKYSIKYIAYETRTFLGNRWKHQIVYPGESYFLLSLHYAWSVIKRKTGLLKMKEEDN